ncbi:MAG: hypothetical protein ACM3PC_10600, partial [Deltaproteobacteria bacterium]
VTVPWSAIKDVLPGASTAFESPAGDMLVVLEDGVLYAFLPRAGVLGPPVAHFALAGDPVLAQWAVGPHVARWTAEVTPLLQRGPPAFK